MMFLMSLVKIKPTMHLMAMRIMIHTKSEVNHVDAKEILAKEIHPQKFLFKQQISLMNFDQVLCLNWSQKSTEGFSKSSSLSCQCHFQYGRRMQTDLKWKYFDSLHIRQIFHNYYFNRGVSILQIEGPNHLLLHWRQIIVKTFWH